MGSDKHYSYLTKEEVLDILDNPPKIHYLLTAEKQRSMFGVVKIIVKNFTKNNGDFIGIVQDGGYDGKLPKSMQRYLIVQRYHH